MFSYCLKCTRNSESKIPKVAVCDSKKLKFIKKQEARGLLSKLTGIKVPILSDLSIANILM